MQTGPSRASSRAVAGDSPGSGVGEKGGPGQVPYRLDTTDRPAHLARTVRKAACAAGIGRPLQRLRVGGRGGKRVTASGMLCSPSEDRNRATRGRIPRAALLFQSATKRPLRLTPRQHGQELAVHGFLKNRLPTKPPIGQIRMLQRQSERRDELDLTHRHAG